MAMRGRRNKTNQYSRESMRIKNKSFQNELNERKMGNIFWD